MPKTPSSYTERFSPPPLREPYCIFNIIVIIFYLERRMVHFLLETLMRRYIDRKKPEHVNLEPEFKFCIEFSMEETHRVLKGINRRIMGYNKLRCY